MEISRNKRLHAAAESHEMRSSHDDVDFFITFLFTKNFSTNHAFFRYFCSYDITIIVWKITDLSKIYYKYDNKLKTRLTISVKLNFRTILSAKYIHTNAQSAQRMQPKHEVTSLRAGRLLVQPTTRRPFSPRIIGVPSRSAQHPLCSLAGFLISVQCDLQTVTDLTTTTTKTLLLTPNGGTGTGFRGIEIKFCDLVDAAFF